MDQIRRLFNHGDTVSKECKSFIKSHENQLTDNEASITLVCQCIENMKENLTSPNITSELTSSSSAVLNQLSACIKTCENIVALEVKSSTVTTTEATTIENHEQMQVLKMLQLQVDDINADFQRQSGHLKKMYENMKVHSTVINVD